MQVGTHRHVDAHVPTLPHHKHTRTWPPVSWRLAWSPHSAAQGPSARTGTPELTRHGQRLPPLPAWALRAGVPGVGCTGAGSGRWAGDCRWAEGTALCPPPTLAAPPCLAWKVIGFWQGLVSEGQVGGGQESWSQGHSRRRPGVLGEGWGGVGGWGLREGCGRFCLPSLHFPDTLYCG